MENEYTLHAVTNTHWDREWYMDFQKTRVRLVHLIDELMTILDSDPEFVSFMLDGQTLLLEDFLAVKPHQRERLTALIREGRIMIGPWYILPDEILISGESHIRNYLLGTRIAKGLGVEKMQIGYLPDSFGHPSQIPQILTGLGMDTIIFWRGATREMDKTEFYWRAPNGSRVFAILMPDGYCTGAELSGDPMIAADRLDRFIENFHGYATTDHIYLSVGGDHMEPSRCLSQTIKDANRIMKNGYIVHTSLPEFVRELKRSVGPGLKEIEGEICGSSRSILLFSTLSSRTYLKQENHFASRMLENELEPLHALYALHGMAYPRDILTVAWKLLMENLPHDSICGCSADRVHRAMMCRYQQVREIGEALFDMAREHAASIDTSGIPDGAALTVFNTTGTSRNDYVEATVDFDLRPTHIQDFNRTDSKGRYPLRTLDNSVGALRPPPSRVRVFDGERELPATLLDAWVDNHMDLGTRRFPREYNVNRCRIAFLAEDIPAMGYKTLKVLPVYDGSGVPKTPLTTRLENEYFIVEPDLENAGITVHDKQSGRTLRGLCQLADGGDCGDTYTYCPPDADVTVYADPASLSARMLDFDSVRQSFIFEGVLRLPEDLDEQGSGRSTRRTDCAFSSVITLYPGIRRVEVRTRVDNTARNHRLRVLFPTGVKAEHHWSAGAFSVDRRDTHPDIDPNRQEIFNTHPQKDFCEANDGQFGLTIANRGLHEYEAYDEDRQTVLAITLLRCTGVMSRRVIKTRADMAAWNVETPEAQCLGLWDFEYSIIPHTGTWAHHATYAEAHAYNLPMRTMQLATGKKGPLPPRYSAVDLETPALQVTAFKQCEFEDAYILRFFNTTPAAVEATLRFSFIFSDIQYANLREDTLGGVELDGHSAKLSVKPFEIVTLKIVP